MSELLGTLVAATLTVFVLTYVARDNRVYRFALHLLIGSLTGYTFGIVVREVVLGMAVPGLVSRPVSIAVPLLLGILLLSKGFPRHAYVGNLSVAYLIGTGAAVALSGALLGTLGPQIAATGRAVRPASQQYFRFGIVDGLMVLVGTVSTLLTFTFIQPGNQGNWGHWGRILRGVRQLGQVFLIIAIGVAFAGALTASLSIFIGRLQYFIDVIARIAGG